MTVLITELIKTPPFGRLFPELGCALRIGRYHVRIEGYVLRIGGWVGGGIDGGGGGFFSDLNVCSLWRAPRDASALPNPSALPYSDSRTILKLVSEVTHTNLSALGRKTARALRVGYRGTSLTRKRTSRGPCRRPMPRVLGGSWGNWACSHSRGIPVSQKKAGSWVMFHL